MIFFYFLQIDYFIIWFSVLMRTWRNPWIFFSLNNMKIIDYFDIKNVKFCVRNFEYFLYFNTLIFDIFLMQEKDKFLNFRNILLKYFAKYKQYTIINKFCKCGNKKNSSQFKIRKRFFFLTVKNPKVVSYFHLWSSQLIKRKTARF